MVFGQVKIPAQVCGGVNLPPDSEFVRGDCNGDGSANISDVISGLGSLFGGGEPPTCVDSCDANDDGGFEISDMIYLLAYLFSGGLPPEPPFPDCGADRSPDLLDCADHRFCP